MAPREPVDTGAEPARTSLLVGSVTFQREEREHAVSMFPCSKHGGRVPGKLASVYWRWFNADGESVGWKQRLCPACSVEMLKPLLAHANEQSTDVSACPACGSDSSQDMEPVFLTLFTPGSEGREYQLTTCSGCAPGVRANAQLRAERLPDRGGKRGAMAPREPEDPFGDLWP